MTNFREVFTYKNNKCLEQDNRIGICENRIEMLEDEIVELQNIIISKIIDVLKNMR